MIDITMNLINKTRPISDIHVLLKNLVTSESIKLPSFHSFANLILPQCTSPGQFLGEVLIIGTWMNTQNLNFYSGTAIISMIMLLINEKKKKENWRERETVRDTWQMLNGWFGYNIHYQFKSSAFRNLLCSMFWSYQMLIKYSRHL